MEVPEERPMRDVQKLLLQDKPVGILLAIKRLDEPYAAVIMREVETTHAHTANVLSQMEEYGLIESVKEGRIKYVYLSPYGKYVTDALEKLINAIDGGEDTGKRSDIDEDALRDKLDTLTEKIEDIYHEEVKDKDLIDKYDATRISRRLGPYRRELLKVKDYTNKDSEIEDTVNAIDTRIDEILQQVKEISD